MSLEAVFAAIAGYLVLHQTLTGRALIGCILILVGVLVQCNIDIGHTADRIGRGH